MESTHEKVERLLKAVENNIKYFENANKCSKLRFILENFKTILEKCGAEIKEIESLASDYDFSAEVSGNGLWSFVDTTAAAVKKSSNICQQLTKRREKFLFRAEYYEKEIDEWAQVIQNLSLICETLIGAYRENSGGGQSLYIMTDSMDNPIFKTLTAINQKPFYGKNYAFQYNARVRPLMRFILNAMNAAFNFYYDDKFLIFKLAQFPFRFAKSLLSPQSRSEKALYVYEKMTTDFCQFFWGLNEGIIVHLIPSLVLHRVKVNRLFEIPAESLEVYSEKKSKMVEIPLPRSHIGVRPVACRLVSSRVRRGMIGFETNSKSAEPSKYLIFHVHGGGWAAQTSKSHELYLRDWARQLDVPILSIDYTLSTEAPFPRALEEVFYAYCWALKNPQLLGSTGENVVVVGDSAGGNLNTACMIKCIEMGIPLPKGLFNIYTPYLVNFVTTPARFIAMLDVILPLGPVARLFKTYASEEDNTDENMNIEIAPLVPEKFDKIQKTPLSSTLEKEFYCKINESCYVSPWNASDEIWSQFPKLKLLTTTLDICLDDNVELAKRLRRMNIDVGLDIVKGIPHGFLYWAHLIKDCSDGTQLCLERIKELLFAENSHKNERNHPSNAFEPGTADQNENK